MKRMKKNRFIILTVLFALFCISSYGQGKAMKPKKLKTSFGVKAGVNLSTINNSQQSLDFSSGMKADFHVGALVNLHFGYRNEGSPVGTGWFGIQPELLYSRQGFTLDGESVNFDYLTIPVMAKVYFTKALNIEVGPYFSYLLSVSPNSMVIDGAQIATSDLKGGMDAGLAVGVGYETKFGLTVGARYNIGMSEMAKNLQWKNNVIAISVGWLF